jgi:hypothetical protein
LRRAQGQCCYAVLSIEGRPVRCGDYIVDEKIQQRDKRRVIIGYRRLVERELRTHADLDVVIHERESGRSTIDPCEHINGSENPESGRAMTIMATRLRVRGESQTFRLTLVDVNPRMTYSPVTAEKLPATSSATNRTLKPRNLESERSSSRQPTLALPDLIAEAKVPSVSRRVNDQLGFIRAFAEL